MSIIYPCHWCERPVYLDVAPLFAHQAHCSAKECRAQHEASEQRTVEAIVRATEQAKSRGFGK